MSSTGTYVVRPPVLADVPALGRLHCRVWQDTYATAMRADAYAALSPERFARGWERRLAGVDRHGVLVDGDTVVVAECDSADGRGNIVAFIDVGPAREEQPPTSVEVWALNVAREHHGTSLAHRLMSDVLGQQPAYLWVARGNERAVAFYRRHNFSFDDMCKSDLRDGISEQRMVRGTGMASAQG